jgi:hypothetical protein
MSDRRAAGGPAGDGHTLPDHLTWRGADDPRWWDDDVQPHSRERFLAHRRFKAARALFLSTLTEKPAGVGDDEWLHAHDMTRADLGKPSARELGL